MSVSTTSKSPRRFELGAPASIRLCFGGDAGGYTVAVYGPVVGALPIRVVEVGTTPADTVITGLQNGTTYSFLVWAKNEAGAEPGAASIRSPEIVQAAAPFSPISVTAITFGRYQAKVSWGAPVPLPDGTPGDNVDRIVLYRVSVFPSPKLQWPRHGRRRSLLQRSRAQRKHLVHVLCESSQQFRRKPPCIGIRSHDRPRTSATAAYSSTPSTAAARPPWSPQQRCSHYWRPFSNRILGRLKRSRQQLQSNGRPRRRNSHSRLGDNDCNNRYVGQPDQLQLHRLRAELCGRRDPGFTLRVTTVAQDDG